MYAFVKNNAVISNDPYGLFDGITGPYSPGTWMKRPSPGDPNYVDPHNTMNGLEMGLEWFLGLAPREVHFDGKTNVVSELKASRVTELIRNDARKQLRIACSERRTAPFDIRITKGLKDINRRKYIFYYLWADMIMNPTAAFVGSFTKGTIHVTSLDCKKCKAKIHFSASNYTGFESLSHYPHDDGTYSRSYLPNLPEGYWGPMHNYIQYFDWDEEIDIQAEPENK